MARWTPERKRKAWVRTVFGSYYFLFLVFIYGPMIAMFIISFNARRGGLDGAFPVPSGKRFEFTQTHFRHRARLRRLAARRGPGTPVFRGRL